MSIKDRLAKKMEGLSLPNKDEPAAAASPATPQGRLRTGPGQMLMVNSLMKENNEKVTILEQRLKEFEGALPVRMVDPKKIIASKWANRAQQNFDTDDFIALKEEIANAQGNVQPIKIRPVKGEIEQYEIIFGHRRHRACLELDLPVLAVIEPVSDQDLFKEMDRENRTRLDLSPWEQGKMYRRALSDGLFLSIGELSKELGVDKGNLSKSLKLADLPDEIVEAFASPLELQYRWAKLLSDAVEQDADGVFKRASELKGRARPGKEVLEHLLGLAPKAGPEVESIIVDGRVIAKMVIDGDKVNVQFEDKALSTEKKQKLPQLLRDFLSK
jgi:ParB family chromosome partitioning protein